ncbi:DUF4214 domain-containing protein [Herbaspirillum sp. GCM10030257]|uniref:glycoside hydrolase family 113 n=1 Tax=Herbaspirillum sp. GCM10030257 TaxID=3273393 RepID=UPI003617906D
MGFDWKSTTFVLQSPGAATADRLADFKAYLAANKAAGLNTITLFSPVPVDPVTGEIKAAFTPGNAYNAEAKSPDYFGAFTAAAHEVGLKVIWKPQFNLDRLQPDNVNEFSTPANFNVANFLAGVKTFWAQWAPAAQAYGADMVIMSTENGAYAAKYEAAWRDIIATIRKDYKGPLTYAENNIVSRDYAHGPDDIPFWDALDFIGVDAYNPVGNGGSTSYETAVQDFHANSVNIRDNGFKVDIPAVLKALSAKFGKPVLFAEFGIRSVAGASSMPAQFALQPGETVDFQEQYNYYKAFLDIYRNESWVAGVSTWNEHNEWSPYPTHPLWAHYTETFGRAGGDYLGKPTEQLLRDYWLEMSAPGITVKALHNADGSFRQNDVLVGGAGADIFAELGGTYRAYGGAKADIAVFTGAQSGYTVTSEGAALKVIDKSGKEGTGTLYDIERLKFADKTIALDIAGSAGQAYRLYQAAFDRKPDLGGLGTWIDLMDKGMSLTEVSSYFQRSDEFKTLYGTTVSDDRFVELLYQNVLDRLPDPGGYATWKGVLEAKSWTREQVLIGFSESTENQVKVIGSIQNGIEYQAVA